MELKDILKNPVSAEQYLADKRAACREKYTAIVEGIRARLSDKPFVEKTVRDAEFALKHQFNLPGTKGLRVDVGTPPRWYEIIDDHEYTWVLSRHYWFVDLVNAYHLTGERKYADAALSDMENWIDSCPRYPVHGTDDARLRKEFGGGVNPWRSFEAGVRMSESWRAVYEGLLHYDGMTPELHAKMSVSAWEHADMLMIVGPLLHPKADHNHYLVQMQGALDAVCMFPEWSVSAEWQQICVREVVRCALYQFTDEGGQIEATPGYHSMCLMRLYTIEALSREYGFALPEEFYRTMAGANEYMCHSLNPSGIVSAIGDTGNGRHGDNVAEDHYRKFGELGTFRKIAPMLSENVRARIAPRDLAEADAYALSLPSETHFQTALGHFMARTGWDRDASYFMATCRTPVNNGHTHQDPMTFCLSLCGDRIVIDPGSFTYQDNVARRTCKSPEYHSCLTFGWRPAYGYLSSWGFTPQKDGRLYREYRVGELMAVDGSHDNYLPNEHKRLYALAEKDVFFVADRVKNVTGEVVSLFFYLDDETVRVYPGEAKGERIRILWANDMQAQSIHSGGAGYPGERQKRRLVLEDRTPCEDALYLTVFTKSDSVRDAKASLRPDGAAEISYTKGDKTHTFVWKFDESLEKA